MDNEGIQLLGDHLANFKLQTEEQIYELEQEILYLRKEIEKKLIENQHLIDSMKHSEIKLQQYKVENTNKSRIQERNDWKTLVNSMQEDKKQLTLENQMLKEKLNKLLNKEENPEDQVEQKVNIEECANDIQTIIEENNELKAKLEQEQLAFHTYRIQAKADIFQARQQEEYLNKKIYQLMNGSTGDKIIKQIAKASINFLWIFKRDSSYRKSQILQV